MSLPLCGPDKRVMAAGSGTSVRELEIAPHVIRGIGSADETVIPTCGTATRCVDKITDEGVGAACSSYEGVVPADGGTVRRIGIADANRLKVTVMDISPIKTQRDYRNTLKAIEGLMATKRNTPEGDRLDVLVTLVEAWERKHYPFDLPDPVEAIKYHMDQNGLQPRDLIPFIGSRNRVHEVLNRRRSLTLKMIWRLHEGLGIPAESLIKVGQEQAA
jgi:HTH-type transcriptional regulator / antitoxin HigA